jgi:HTH-type transcriptional regulator / antitoxin HigA
MSDEEYKTPGQLIQELLDARGWSQRVLSIVLGIDETGLNKIISGKRQLDATLALQISAVFDVEAERLLEIQKRYDLALARLVSRPNPALVSRAKLFGDLPVTEMIKRGWLGATDIKNVPLVEKALCSFFGQDDLSQIHALPSSFKRTDGQAPITQTQLAWLYRVRQMATDYPSAKFAPAKLESALAKLQSLLISSEGVRKVPKLLMEAGVRYVLVESIPAAKIDGVCCWLDDEKPVIGMSLRFDRIDNFWFVLRHEIEHVLRGHGKELPRLDIDMEKEVPEGEMPEEERIANSAAAEFCVPGDRMLDFIARKSPVFAERDIRGFSAVLQRHPGIIAGQLQHQTKRYDLFRNHLVKIRSIILPTAEHDGWGDVAQIG